MAQRPPAVFIADALALDFLNTVAAPVDETIDFLDSGEALLSWMSQAKMVEVKYAEEICRATKPGELDEIALQAPQASD